MNLPSFIAAAARRARFGSTHRDPLVAAYIFLDQHGQTAEGEALRRVIRALATKGGDFPEADLWLLGADALALITALANARYEGRYSDADWQAF